MGKLRLGFDNLIDGANLTVGSQSLNLPGYLLQDPIVARVWRTFGTNSSYVIADLGNQLPFGGSALIGTNLTESAVVRFRASATDPTVTSDLAYDSGSYNAITDELYPDVILFVGGLAARYVRWDIVDTAVPYIEVGRWFVGMVWQPLRSMMLGWSSLWLDPSRHGISESGQEWIQEERVKRGYKVQLGSISADERATYVYPIGLRTAQKRDVLLCVDDGSDQVARDSVWGLIQDTMEVSNPSNGLYSWSFTVMERL